MSFFQKDPIEKLVKALQRGDVDVIREIFKNDPAAVDRVIDLGPKGYTTPLHIAVELSHADLARFLVGELGAQIKNNGHDIRVDAELEYAQKHSKESKEICEVLDGAQHAQYQLELPPSKTFKGKA